MIAQIYRHLLYRMKKKKTGLSKYGKALQVALVFLVVVNLFEFAAVRSLRASVSQPELDLDFQLERTENCPERIMGNNISSLHVQYFFTDNCPWCQRQKPVMENLGDELGEFFYVEWYNVDQCAKQSVQAKVVKVPFFVFLVNDEKIHGGGGFINEADFRKFICQVSGGC